MLLPKQRVRHRRFQYQPRYYDPTRDERLKRRIRIKSKARRGRTPGLLWFLILCLMALYVYFKLG